MDPSAFGMVPQHMGCCQNYGPFLSTLNIRCRNVIGIQKGTIILTTTHMSLAKFETGMLPTLKYISKGTLTASGKPPQSAKQLPEAGCSCVGVVPNPKGSRTQIIGFL